MRPVPRFSSLARVPAVAAVGLLLLVAASSTRADSDRPPVVLDTQTGIHDGKSGIVMQNAPLVREPMVPATTLTDVAPRGQPPIIVSPYVELPGGANPRAVYRQRPASGQ